MTAQVSGRWTSVQPDRRRALRTTADRSADRPPVTAVTVLAGLQFLAAGAGAIVLLGNGTLDGELSPLDIAGAVGVAIVGAARGRLDLERWDGSAGSSSWRCRPSAIGWGVALVLDDKTPAVVGGRRPVAGPAERAGAPPLVPDRRDRPEAPPRPAKLLEQHGDAVVDGGRDDPVGGGPHVRRGRRPSPPPCPAHSNIGTSFHSSPTATTSAALTPRRVGTAGPGPTPSTRRTASSSTHSPQPAHGTATPSSTSWSRRPASTSAGMPGRRAMSLTTSRSAAGRQVARPRAGRGSQRVGVRTRARARAGRPCRWRRRCRAPRPGSAP